MIKVKRVLAAFLSAIALAIAPAAAWAGGEKATLIENVADTRDMAPGLGKFLADTYNANLWLFGLYVVLVMAGMGTILGFGIDKLMTLTGISLGKLDHHE